MDETGTSEVLCVIYYGRLLVDKRSIRTVNGFRIAKRVIIMVKKTKNLLFEALCLINTFQWF